MSTFEPKTGRAIAGQWSGAAPPTPCTPGDFYIKVDNPLGQRVGTCTATNIWEFPTGGVSSTPTGSGFRRITIGVEDAVASFPSKAEVGLGSADNTSDASKPVSTATQSVLDSKQATLGFTPENIANKNAASGYVGLSVGSKIAASQMSAVLASSDLTNDSALEKTANKNVANGYASLNASSRVPIANLASGVPDGTKFIRDDGTLVTPAGGGAVSSVFTRTGAVVATSGDYTVAQVTGAEATANKGAVSGYAGLGANSRVPTAQLGSGTADATTFLRGDQTYAAPSGGSDPWTYVRLISDFVTSSATAVDVTGMSFTPAANLRYEISGIFLLRTATTTVGPRTGVAWPTGMADGVVVLRVESAAGTQVVAQGNINAAVLVPVGGLPTNTQSYPGELRGMLLAGATPSSTFRIQLASETAGTNVTIKAGSFIRYRTF